MKNFVSMNMDTYSKDRMNKINEHNKNRTNNDKKISYLLELMKIYKYGEGDIKKVNDILDKTIKEKSLDIEDIEEYNIDYDMDIKDIINNYMEKSIISSMKV